MVANADYVANNPSVYLKLLQCIGLSRARVAGFCKTEQASRRSRHWELGGELHPGSADHEGAAGSCQEMDLV